MRIAPAHVAKRQATAIPTASGLGAVQTASIGANTGSALLLGSNTAGPGPSVSAALLAGGGGVTITAIITSATASPTSTGASSAASSSSVLSTGAIIGVIIAAFAGFVLCIFLVYGCLRRRWAKALEQRPRRPAGASATRNTTGGEDDRRSRAQPRGKLDDDKDTWEGSEKKTLADGTESNRLSLFRKASSTRSGTEEKSTAPHEFDPSTMPNFAQYHPELAAELATRPPVPPFVAGSQDSRSSSGGETASGDSFLSLRLSDTSAMSPGSATIKTPITIASTLHRWQSAEVLTMDNAEAADSVEVAAAAPASNPFEDNTKKSGGSNPFFSSHPSSGNPFADPQAPRSRRPTITHTHSNSSDSVDTVRVGPMRPDSNTRPESNAQAMQSLLAALDANPDQRASVQASVDESHYAQTERTSMASFVTYTPKAM
jgi:hypothetical protein